MLGWPGGSAKRRGVAGGAGVSLLAQSEARSKSPGPSSGTKDRTGVTDGNAGFTASHHKPHHHDVRERKADIRGLDLAFDARGSYVHFAQHGTKMIVPTGDHYMGNQGQFRNFFSRLGWYESSRAEALRDFLRTGLWQSITMGLLALALLAADVFVLLQIPSNIELDVTLTAAFLVFGTDLIMMSAADINYPFSFFFIMDVVGTFSMVLDISYMKGPDATKPLRLDEKQGDQNYVVLRATRLAARAGRLSRVTKVLRFLSVAVRRQNDDGKTQVARVISQKLQDVLSIRVAFLTICVAILLPIFKIFEYPEMDDSLLAWTQMISADVDDYMSDQQPGNLKALESELRRFSSWYEGSMYGPFGVCYGEADAFSFDCANDVLPLRFNTSFHVPRRRASILEMTRGDVQVFYDMSKVAQMEAAMSVGIISFLIVVMVGFSLALSSSITEIALTPLERMLSVVRSRCAEIFKYTANLHPGEGSAGARRPGDSEKARVDAYQSSEFDLLEKAVSKLAAIAHLSAKPTEPDATEEMTETDVMVLNFQGQALDTDGISIVNAAPTSPPASRKSMRASVRGSPGMRISRLSLHAPVPIGRSNATSRFSLMSIAEAPRESPVETLVESVPEEVVAETQGPRFDAFDLTLQAEMKVGLAVYMFYTVQGAADYMQTSVQRKSVHKFAAQAEKNYPPNMFHNFSHALDVTYEVASKMRLIDVGRFMPEGNQFWLMVAALGHDLGHVGVNNQFLIETAHELAVMYNDKSPLENLHCSKLFQILSDPEANVFATIDRDCYREFRKGIIGAILHTDVIKHKEMIKDLSLLFQMNASAFLADGVQEEAVEVLSGELQMTANSLLHLCDVGNPMKPWPLARKLALLCMDEFFLQGDQEKQLGIPVGMLNDRNKVNKPNSQIGFIEFMMLPFVETMVNIFPMLDVVAKELDKNTGCWKDLWLKEEAHDEAAIEKMTSRVQKVTDRCLALDRFNHDAGPRHRGSR